MRKTVLVVALLMTGTAYAEPPGLVIPTPTAHPHLVFAAPPVEHVVERRSYRWQVIATDVAAAGALAYSLSHDHDESGMAGFAAYGLGAPIVHAANGHGLRAIASLGLRAGIPLVAGLAGARLDDRGIYCASADGIGGDCKGITTTERAGFYEGLVVGAVVAMVVDCAFVAQPETRVRSGWSPTAGALRGGGTIGVAATF